MIIGNPERAATLYDCRRLDSLAAIREDHICDKLACVRSHRPRPVSVRYPGSPADRAVSGSCPGGGAGSSSDHVDLAGPLPVIWAISFGDHIHSRAREALAYPSGDRTRLAPAGLPSTRATRMAPAPNRATDSAPARSLAITLDRIQRYIRRYGSPRHLILITLRPSRSGRSVREPSWHGSMDR